MINVKLAGNGDVVMTCTMCPETIPENAIVSFAMAASPFWNIHVGDALLIMLGHIQVHYTEETPLHDSLRTEPRTLRCSWLRLPGNVGIRG